MMVFRLSDAAGAALALGQVRADQVGMGRLAAFCLPAATREVSFALWENLYSNGHQWCVVNQAIAEWIAGLTGIAACEDVHPLSSSPIPKFYGSLSAGIWRDFFVNSLKF